ncbi:MAG: ATP-binding cassette domain-containing protein [Clostridia bacterium]|nr:ATP-binding cassette domain-containing protein [Clostridia bacterium]
MIFQDPSASLDPRQSCGKAIEEVFEINTNLPAAVRKENAMDLLEKVGLKREHYYSYPHALSGGQKQRVGIARAIASEPSFVVLDEAVSALDVSVKAQILQLLDELSEEKKLTYFFITHDLGVAKHFCDRILVMYLGNICELAPSKELFRNRLHPYTESLLDSVPRLAIGEERKQVEVLEGEVPSAINPPKGCPFHTRCKKCMDICMVEKPKYVEAEPNHFVACHLYDKKEN